MDLKASNLADFQCDNDRDINFALLTDQLNQVENNTTKNILVRLKTELCCCTLLEQLISDCNSS